MSSFILAATYDSLNSLQKMVFDLFYNESNVTLELIKKYVYVTDFELTAMSQLYSYLLPIAYALVIFYFLVDLIDKMTLSGKNITLEQFLLSILRLILAYSVMEYGAELLGLLVGVGNVMAQYWVNNPIGTISGDLGTSVMEQAILDGAADMGFWSCLGALIMGTIVNILSAIPAILITLHAITRKFEIIIRGGFSCVALADIITEGKNSVAVRFMKKFAALMIHGSVMTMIVTLSIALQIASVTTDAYVFEPDNLIVALNAVLYSFAAVGMISASKSIINEALGT